MDKKIKTTVIGSYPVKINNFELIKNYYNYSNPNFRSYIRSAVDDMVRSGIDIISDGQIRDPFVNIFYRKINGIRIRNRAEIIDKISYNGNITVEDLKYVKNIIPKKNKIIGLLAGPYTLTKSCVNNYYNDEKELSYDFAEILSKEAKELEKFVDMISVDEPFFSLSIPDYSIDLINNVIKNIRCKTRLHVCGDVSNIINDLLEMPIDILSHEFKARPNLLKDFSNYDFNKELCLGSVRSDKKDIEKVEDIKNHIKKAKDLFGEKIIQVSPDCGLRQLNRECAYKKLKNLVIACREINDKKC